MAVGDTFSGLQSIANGAYLDIRPIGTQEVVIHNIYHADDVSLEFYDGTNSIVFATAVGAGIYAYYAFHITNTRRIRVQNTSGGVALIGYDGIETHT